MFCPPDWLHSHDVQGVYIDNMHKARNADQVARTLGKGLFHSIVKITRFYSFQTWPTHLIEKFMRCAKGMRAFLSFFWVLIGRAGKPYKLETKTSNGETHT